MTDTTKGGITPTDYPTPAEMELLRNVDEAIKRAGKLMDMEDVTDDIPQDEQDAIYEARFHCGVCIVNAVMEEIWLDLNALMDFYKEFPVK